jgi:hypothetical protein
MQTSKTPLTIDQIARYAPSPMAIAAHESRSNRYTYIPTVDVVRGMEKAGFLPFAASQSRTRDDSRREFTKHMIRFRRADQSPVSVGDVLPEIVLINSHDGTSAYRLMAGLFRLVCSNGMVIADAMVASLRIKHSGDIVRQVVDGSHAIAEQSTKTLGTVRDWSQLQLTSGEQSAFAVAAHQLRFADGEGQTHTPITPSQLLTIRRSADSGNDLWRTFNRVQENVIKGGLSAIARNENGRRVRRVSTREVKGIDQDVRLNRSLWTLAEKLAEYKASV